jgi:hypothetical protein
MFGSATAAGAVALAAACSHGNYDGSYEGGVGGGSEGGVVVVERVVQPGQSDTLTAPNRVFEVTIAAGTFPSAATVTVTARADVVLDNGVVVPVYDVHATQEPKQPIQVVFYGNGQPTGGGGINDRTPVAALQEGTTFKPLPIVGSSNGAQTGAYWGLSKSFGTFSLALVAGVQGSGLFADIPLTCTAACCGAKGSQSSAFKGGCYCASAPDHACFLEHCKDLDVAATRCTAIASSANLGDVTCKAFGAQCPGPGCGDYPNNGFCTTGGTGTGPGSGSQACCVTPGNHGKCANSPQACTGFAVRCTAANNCPLGSSCCVFDSESYCAKDCPPSKRACTDNGQCVDAGAEGGTCQGGGCPVGVCGALPAGCR